MIMIGMITIFTIKDTQLYAPGVTLSAKDKAKDLKDQFGINKKWRIKQNFLAKNLNDQFRMNKEWEYKHLLELVSYLF